MPTTIAIESKNIVVFGLVTPFQHLYLVKTVTDAAGKVLDERVIRGDVGQDLTLVTQADVALATSPDARDGQTLAQRHHTTLDLGGRDPDEVWSLMVQHALNIDRANLPYGTGVVGDTGPLDVNSNTTVASVLHTVGIEFAQNVPVGVLPKDVPLAGRVGAILVNDVLVGGEQADTIRGGVGNDRLDGNNGNDRLFGEAGNDVLIGRAGDDRLDGGIGADVMVGGVGNDLYFVNNRGDRVIEASVSLSAGDDRVVSSISFNLSARAELAGIERLTLVGTLDRNGVGNTLANVLAGNPGDNVLSGRAGDDKVLGGSGNDHLFGEAGNDVLRGGSGDDTLVGGIGRDILVGDQGTDTFVFRSVSESRADSADVVVDFEAEDRIDLQVIDANTLVSGNQAFQFIGSDPFTSAGQVRVEQDGSGNTWVEANVNAGLGADFRLLLRDFTGPLTASDFEL